MEIENRIVTILVCWLKGFFFHLIYKVLSNNSYFEYFRYFLVFCIFTQEFTSQFIKTIYFISSCDFAVLF